MLRIHFKTVGNECKTTFGNFHVFECLKFSGLKFIQIS